VRGVHLLNANIQRPKSAARGTKQSKAHHMEWPMRFSTIPAGMANRASAIINVIMKDELTGSCAMWVPRIGFGAILITFSFWRTGIRGF